jgi:hypothetical protein
LITEVGLTHLCAAFVASSTFSNSLSFSRDFPQQKIPVPKNVAVRFFQEISLKEMIPLSSLTRKVEMMYWETQWKGQFAGGSEIASEIKMV